MLALYDRIEDAAETVSAIIAARIIPCTLEFLDRMTAGCVEDYAHVGLPTDCDAVLLMETDGHPAAVADESERMADIARAARRPRSARRAETRPKALALAAARRNAFSALARRRPTTILEDVTVPRSELATMVAIHRRDGARAASCRSAPSATWATAISTRRSSPTSANADEMQRVHHALDAIVTKTLELGGTITGEHGVGLAKKAWLRQQMGDEQLRADEAGQARASIRPAC